MSVQYLGNISYDISETIRDYDYTKKAVVNFNRLVNSKDFEKMDTESIFRYLYKQMEVVSFGDFLRRYIYELTRIPLPFNEVSDDYYISYIAESFERNRAPRAFGPVKSRWKNIIKRWLRDGSVKRDTVFLLGFGLNMTDQNVSMFLTKVIKEQDFNFDDPRETVFWHCYHGGLPYSTVAALMKDYENLPVGNKQSEVWQSMNAEMIPDTDRTKTLKTEPELTLETDLNKNPQSDVKLSQSLELAKSCAENLSRTTDISQNIDSDPESVFWKSIQGSLRIYLSNESMLKRYLKYLKSRYIVSEDKVYCSFMDLYRKAVQVVSQITKNQSEDAEEQAGDKLNVRKHVQEKCDKEGSGAYGIENVLCSGMPRTGQRNLMPVARSVLAAQFEKKRMSRHRILRILKKEARVERFDIITLLFLNYSAEVEADWPNERLIRYIDEVNGLLLRCDMMEIYPVNPYESFILMCLLTEDPISSYNEVWEMSFQEQDQRK